MFAQDSPPSPPAGGLPTPAAAALQDHPMAAGSGAVRVVHDAMGEDEDGEVLVEDPPRRPDPVARHGIDAGCVELY